MNRREFLKGAAVAAAGGAATAVAGATAQSAAAPAGAVVYSRSIPVAHDVDVFVAGGGPTGVCAALAAAPGTVPIGIP